MTLRRACLGCGKLGRWATRCPACERDHDRQRGSRQQRGYDAAHDALRAHLVAALDSWTPCPRCRQPLGPDPALLDLMHNDDRTGWFGLGHRRCNRDVRSLDDPGNPLSPQGGRPRTPRPSNFPTDAAAPKAPYRAYLDGPVVA